MKRFTIPSCRVAAIAALAATVACGGGGTQEDPVPVSGFGVLSGKTVVVLPVQYVRQVPGGWPGGASSARDAARQADAEITFALSEYGGRATWISPEMQVEALERQPAIQGVNPYLLSADPLRREGKDAKYFRDPLLREVRMISALFDSRYLLWPMEIIYLKDKDADTGRLAIRTYLLDVRAGTALAYVLVPGDDQPPATAGALAAMGQEFAVVVSP